MKESIDKFIGLGGRFEVGVHDTYLIYNNCQIRIPNKYFTSTDKEYKDVLNYYLDMMPKIGEQRGVILPKEFVFEFIE